MSCESALPVCVFGRGTFDIRFKNVRNFGGDPVAAPSWTSKAQLSQPIARC